VGDATTGVVTVVVVVGACAFAATVGAGTGAMTSTRAGAGATTVMGAGAGPCSQRYATQSVWQKDVEVNAHWFDTTHSEPIPSLRMHCRLCDAASRWQFPACWVHNRVHTWLCTHQWRVAHCMQRIRDYLPLHTSYCVVHLVKFAQVDLRRQ